MAHKHYFDHQPKEEGFDGLGVKENNSVGPELCQTVYYMIHDCAEKNCPESRFQSWLFEIDSFNLCCDDVHPDEPSESMEAEFNDFTGDDDPIVVDFTCRHCGETQTLKSDHIYRSEL